MENIIQNKIFQNSQHFSSFDTNTGRGNISRWHEIVYIRQQQAIRRKSMLVAMKVLTQEVKLQLFVLRNSCTFIN